ncbi:VOC family protein [Actinoplanes sp. NPDC051633]|uniref:VOC family protein n=1 Tax=Actinoplanes sp. NPDC051633 TaxID=3155670 RepID=UPI00342031F5
MGLNGNAWFEIGTDDREGTERFYTDAFGWSFIDDDSISPDGKPYRMVVTGPGEPPSGGVTGVGGTRANYSTYFLLVADTAEACRKVEAAGGKVEVPATTNTSGLSWAHLLDPQGNRFGVFTPPRG